MGAFTVPTLFSAGQHVLLTTGQTDSFGYLSLSALALAVSILPWCVAMGATFPFMMAYLREGQGHARQSFSFLYLANVLGAMAGTLLTALVLVEAFGFRHTLWIAAAGNISIAATCAWLAVQRRSEARRGTAEPLFSSAFSPVAPRASSLPLSLLFSTGFISMAMEVVWIRAFTPVLKTQIYSFALVLATYLGATYAGSMLYRGHLKHKKAVTTARLVSILAAVTWLPVVANDVRWVHAHWGDPPKVLSVIIVLASIIPFCAALGYLTPQLVDEYSGGEAAPAGRAYAVNVLGCILGPLAACYLLLPWVSERHALLLLGLPLVAFYLVCKEDAKVGHSQSAPRNPTRARRLRLALGLVSGALLVGVFSFPPVTRIFS